MRSICLSFIFAFFPFFCLANNINITADIKQAPAHQDKTWFSNSLSYHSSHFDTWTISSGYHYPILDNMNIYVATEIISESINQNSESGFLSGIQYMVNDGVTVDSNIQAETRDHDLIRIIEMSSRFRLSRDINLEAKIDYNFNQTQKSEANYHLGVGYRF